ncbi:hypothetical protein EGW08_001137 [Elysia chlorotica]|uniref:Tctex1 domain-containing protein 2 n=1 Tax=Elysia chlorotica TaxID=188477 RepID=A0A433UBG2_ELYCH|nr:hypothetical protein EGW08_001137 [Elysia chlorotica]
MLLIFTIIVMIDKKEPDLKLKYLRVAPLTFVVKDAILDVWDFSNELCVVSFVRSKLPALSKHVTLNNIMGEEGVEPPIEHEPSTTVSMVETTPDVGPQNTYIIRPNFSQKFRPINVKEMIHVVLGEMLTGKSYNAEETTSWTKDISETIKKRLKDMGHERYKFVVQVVIGEQRGEGVKMGCRCFWDSDTDNYAQDIFMNESLFCVAAAYGIFKY